LFLLTNRFSLALLNLWILEATFLPACSLYSAAPTGLLEGFGGDD
jgi:hypothetical protein